MAGRGCPLPSLAAQAPPRDGLAWPAMPSSARAHRRAGLGIAVAEIDNRRPIAARGSAWARWVARRLADASVRPDLISGASAAFAALGAALLLAAGVIDSAGLRAVLLLAVAAMIQLRLVCNLLDGMVAMEHGRGSPAG